MQEELSGIGFVIFEDRVNILQIFQVDIIGKPTNDTRLVLNWTPSSTKCSTSHWLLKVLLICHWLLLKPCVGIENMFCDFCLTWVHWLAFTTAFLAVREKSLLHLDVVTLMQVSTPQAQAFTTSIRQRHHHHKIHTIIYCMFASLTLISLTI
jgi:hypothetical protein